MPRPDSDAPHRHRHPSRVRPAANGPVPQRAPVDRRAQPPAPRHNSVSKLRAGIPCRVPPPGTCVRASRDEPPGRPKSAPQTVSAPRAPRPAPAAALRCSSPSPSPSPRLILISLPPPPPFPKSQVSAEPIDPAACAADPTRAAAQAGWPRRVARRRLRLCRGSTQPKPNLHVQARRASAAEELVAAALRGVHSVQKDALEPGSAGSSTVALVLVQIFPGIAELTTRV
jgi:hypothetical protein